MLSKNNSPHILLVNPWIYDFAAYDYWAKPMGLLSLAAILREHDINVSYVDCLDRFHPQAPATDPHARCGRGPYLKTPVSKPAGLNDINRTFSRYGIKTEWFHETLAAIPKPDLILVTSMMTYWYPGVIETIRQLKIAFPETTIVLGGIYARLCTEHAKLNSGADHVAVDGGSSLFTILKKYTGVHAAPKLAWNDLDTHPFPAYDLQRKINYIPLLTGRGCLFDCAYCASSYLEPVVLRRSPRHVVEEIAYWCDEHGVVDFVFYDDALLINSGRHAVPILEGIIRKNMHLRFHTPNALHIREITAETADLMFRAGFYTLRLGLETTSFDDRISLDRKVEEKEFKQAVSHLRIAGFRADQIGAYLLVGLPGQALQSVQASIELVKHTGITPVMAHYTPIPHSRLWSAAIAASRYDLAGDPVFTNNAVMPCSSDGFSWQVLSGLKRSIQSSA